MPAEIYALVSNKDIVYANAGTTVSAIGRVAPNDVSKGLKIVAQFDTATIIPPTSVFGEEPRVGLVGMNMTYDGHIVIGALDGVAVVDSAFTKGQFQSFEDNNQMATNSLSKDTRDGVWKAQYDGGDTVFANNVTSMFLSMRAELRQMIAQGHGGAIVNIGSIAGLTGLPRNPAYSASKHAVVGLTRNASIDYAPHGIRINSVNMAQTDTPMVFRAYEFAKWAMEQGAGASMAGAKSQSLLQMADPDQRGSTLWEQAAVILFLLSDDAANLTGLAMATDGGWTAY